MMLVLLIAIAAQDPAVDKVKEHIAGLRSEDIESREAAAKALEELGEGALAALKAAIEAETDAEIKAQLTGVVARIGKAAARAKVYRAPRPVSVTAKDRPLEDVVKDACAQAGAAWSVEPSLAGRAVSVAAEKQPLLQVLDALCGGDVTYEVADGKIAFKKEKHVRCPTAYADGFRIRLRRTTVFETNTFEESSATAILYFAADCEPGIAPRGARLVRDGITATVEKAAQAFTPVLEGRTGGSSSSGNRGTLFVDDVPVAWDDQVRLETACLSKNLPAGARRFDTLKVKTAFRFAPATRVATTKVKHGARGATFEGVPLRVNYYGMHLQVELTGAATFESIADPTSLVVVTSDNKEHKCRSMHDTGRWRTFFCEEVGNNREEVELRLTVFEDVFDREVEFELKDVKFRD